MRKKSIPTSQLNSEMCPKGGKHDILIGSWRTTPQECKKCGAWSDEMPEGWVKANG